MLDWRIANPSWHNSIKHKPSFQFPPHEIHKYMLRVYTETKGCVIHPFILLPSRSQVIESRTTWKGMDCITLESRNNRIPSEWASPHKRTLAYLRWKLKLRQILYFSHSFLLHAFQFLSDWLPYRTIKGMMIVNHVKLKLLPWNPKITPWLWSWLYEFQIQPVFFPKKVLLLLIFHACHAKSVEEKNVIPSPYMA